ncbi:MAG: hypothetical protein HGA37_09335 [Lentimicrobium sp.]|nr:hypothetical protein [Lentimicrobium sp.]
MEKYNIILSYTYVRSEFIDNKDVYIPSAWDNRHLLNVTLSREFKRNWTFGARWRFVGGSPYSPWDMVRSSLKTAWDVRQQGYLDYSQFNTLRIGNFHQLDVRIDKQYFFDKWSLNLYVDIQNLYNFKQAGAPNLTIDNDNPSSPESLYYNLKEIENTSGTVLPTIGIIIEL